MGINGAPHPLGESWGKKIPGLGRKVGSKGGGCFPVVILFALITAAFMAGHFTSPG